MRTPKAPLSLEGRLKLVLASTKRDFLVVKVCVVGDVAYACFIFLLLQLIESADYVEDPDAKIDLASTGDEYCVSS